VCVNSLSCFASYLSLFQFIFKRFCNMKVTPKQLLCENCRCHQQFLLGCKKQSVVGMYTMQMHTEREGEDGCHTNDGILTSEHFTLLPRICSKISNRSSSSAFSISSSDKIPYSTNIETHSNDEYILQQKSLHADLSSLRMSFIPCMHPEEQNSQSFLRSQRE
jgi:hypothetical protein